MEIKLKKLFKDAKTPTKGSDKAAAYDVMPIFLTSSEKLEYGPIQQLKSEPALV